MLDSEPAKIYPDYELHQVKSKYGTLRYYVGLPHEADEDFGNEIHDIIDRYEELSAYVCEVCGQEGKKTSNQRWIKTRCENHKE